MSHNSKSVEIIDLCSNSEGDSDHDAVDGQLHFHAKSDSTNRRARKRSRTCLVQEEAITLLQDENIDITDLSQLLAQLAKSLERVSATAVRLCSTATEIPSTLYHIRQQDQWSCGYRNLQMIMVTLLSRLQTDHEYFRARPKQQGQLVEIMTLLEIQHLLEQAWQSGWDAKGAIHYRGNLAHKRAWIGAVEVATALGFCHLDATIVQFIKCRESQCLLGPFCKAHFEKKAGCCYCLDKSSRQCVVETLQMVESTAEILRGEPRSCTCPVLPLYLQWEGHSVTVIGVELDKHLCVTQLLVLDPMKSGSATTDELQQGRLAPLRKAIAPLMNRNSQLVVCSTKTLSLQGRTAMKQTANCVTAAGKAVEKSLRAKGTK